LTPQVSFATGVPPGPPSQWRIRRQAGRDRVAHGHGADGVERAGVRHREGVGAGLADGERAGVGLGDREVDTLDGRGVTVAVVGGVRVTGDVDRRRVRDAGVGGRPGVDVDLDIGG